MTCEAFYELLEKIKKKPGLYIGEKSITKLRHFLDGIFYIQFHSNGPNKPDVLLEGFQEWIQIRYDVTASQHWSSILRFFASTEAEAFDLFYTHLEEFLNLEKEERDYENILKKKEEWLKLRRVYWEEYNKIRF